MEAATIAAIEAAAVERIDAKGERKSALTREIIRLAMDSAKGRSPKGRKTDDKPVQTATERAAIRLERYRKGNWQDGFWTGPATDTQIARIVKAGGTVRKDMLAWQAAEEYARISAEAKGLPFVSLVKKAA